MLYVSNFIYIHITRVILKSTYLYITLWFITINMSRVNSVRVGFHKKLSNWLGLSFISQTKSSMSLNEIFTVCDPKLLFSTWLYSWPHFLTVYKDNVKTILKQYLKLVRIWALTTFVYLTNVKISRRLEVL